MRKKFVSGVLGIVVALGLGAVIMLIEGFNPITTYSALFSYSLGGLLPPDHDPAQFSPAHPHWPFGFDRFLPPGRSTWGSLVNF